VGEDLLVFVREHPAGSVLVAARRGAAPAVTLPAGALGWTDGTLLLTTGVDDDLREKDGEVTVPATDAPAVALWRL
jgi:alpha-glucosidase